MQVLRILIEEKKQELERLEALHKVLHDRFHDALPDEGADIALTGMLSARR